MSQSNFVSFSNMLKNRGKEKKVEPEPEVVINYEELHQQALAEKAECEQRIAELQRLLQESKELQEKQHAEFQQTVQQLEQSVLQWKEELAQGIPLVWRSFLEKIFHDERFHHIALQEILTKALSELILQKKIIVEAPNERVDFIRSLLQEKPEWSVVANEELEVGLRFTTEQIEWSDHLKPVFEEFLTLIDQFSKEQR